MKRLLSITFTAVLSAALLTACAEQQTPEKSDAATSSQATAAQTAAYPKKHPLYFKDSMKSSAVTATFFNSVSGRSEDVPMTKVGEDPDSYTFFCEGSCADYNMATITCDGTKLREIAFNPCVSGWYKTEDDFLPYTVGEEIDYSPHFETFTLTGHGYEKRISVWKPDGYDPSSPEKYAAVYVLDGQFMTYNGENGQVLNDCTIADIQVRAMNAAADQKAIVVAINNVGTRDYELIPDIGDSVIEKDFESRNGTPYEDEFDSMDGTELADFIANTLVPYVHRHYNVAADPLHTAVVGASLGGAEAFYIALEYPEIFGTCGALSPSFWTFEPAVWDAYLKSKRFDQAYPMMYLYTGGDDSDVGANVREMWERLEKTGYPKEKRAFHYNEDGAHGGIFWRSIFSEFLTAMVYQQVEPLQQTANG